MTEGPPAPGDVPPRTLARPPGERYGPMPGAAVRSGGANAAAMSLAAPNVVRATLFGTLAGLGVAALFAIVVGILDLGIGLLALAVLGGLGIGFATRSGAWRSSVGRGPGTVRPLAVLLALLAWVAGYFGAYLLSLLLRPDSSLTFGERIAQTSFIDWLSPQFGVPQVLEILLIVLFAAYASRSAVTGPSAA